MNTAPTTTSSPAGAQLYSMRWIVAAVVLAANTMDLLDATIVNVAGPSIHRQLGGAASTIQWLSAAYTLAFAVLLIAGARLGDISCSAWSGSLPSPPPVPRRRASARSSPSAPCREASAP
jgi:MFS family permease